MSDFKHVPIIDADDISDKTLQAAIRKTHGSTAYRNDRERPYNGQPWTYNGARGAAEVRGITFRDLADCIVQGMLSCADPDIPEQRDLQRRVVEKHPEFMDTEFAARGDWRHDDIYDVDFSKVEPSSIVQSALTFVEHYMGIYPNLPDKG